MTYEIFLDEAVNVPLTAPSAQPYICLPDTFLCGCALSLQWRDRRESSVLQFSFQYHTVTLDQCRMTGRAHMAEQNHSLASGLDVPQQLAVIFHLPGTL